MTDVEQPDPEPVGAPESIEAPAPPPEPEPAPETPEIADGGRWLVLRRARWTTPGGDEHFAGPGETVDAAAAAQIDPDSLEAL